MRIMAILLLVIASIWGVRLFAPKQPEWSEISRAPPPFLTRGDRLDVRKHDDGRP
jgi:hypothetical protein